MTARATIRAIGFDAVGTLFDGGGIRQRGHAAVERALRAGGCSVEMIGAMFRAFRDIVDARLEDRNFRASYREKLTSCFEDCMTTDLKHALSPAQTVSILLSEYPRIPAFEDARPMLDLVAGRGYPVGILSNADPDWFAESLPQLDTDWRCVLRVNWTLGAKPTKDAFDRFAGAMDFEASEIVYVGDDLECDVVGALEAGMNAVFVTRGSTPVDTSGLRETYGDRFRGVITQLSSLSDVI